MLLQNGEASNGKQKKGAKT